MGDDPTSGPGARRSAPRTGWVDAAKGIGIILVVYGHVLRANLNLAVAPAWAFQDRVIYSFHMPLFFLLSGLFLWGSIGRGKNRFLRDRWVQLVWPYLLWSAITAALELLLSPWVNTPIPWQRVLLIPLLPIEQYWFLYILLAIQLLILLVHPHRAGALLLGLLALAGFGHIWLGTLTPVLRYLPFVIAAILIGPALVDRIGRTAGSALALLAGGSLVLAAVLTLPLPQMPAVMLSGFAGSCAVIGLAMLAERVDPLGRILILLGQASMAIYVCHTIASAGTRIGLKLVGVAPFSALSLLLCTMAGLVGPVVLWRLAGRTGWSRWMGLGSPPPQTQSGRPAPASVQ